MTLTVVNAVARVKKPAQIESRNVGKPSGGARRLTAAYVTPE